MTTDAFKFSTDVDLRGLAEVLPDEMDPAQVDPDLWRLLVEALREMKYEAKPELLADPRETDGCVEEGGDGHATPDDESQQSPAHLVRTAHRSGGHPRRRHLDPGERWKSTMRDGIRDGVFKGPTEDIPLSGDDAEKAIETYGLDDPDEYVAAGSVDQHNELVRRSERLPKSATYEHKHRPCRCPDCRGHGIPIVLQVGSVSEFKRRRGVEGERYRKLEDVPEPQEYEGLTGGERPLPDEVIEHLEQKSAPQGQPFHISFDEAESMFEQFTSNETPSDDPAPCDEEMIDEQAEQPPSTLTMVEHVDRERFLRYVESGESLPAFTFHDDEGEVDFGLTDVEMGEAYARLVWTIHLK